MAQELVNQCPLCNHTDFDLHLICEDYLLSHEHFDLKKCRTCSFIFTSPRPSADTLSSYYESTQYVSHTGKPAGLINSLYLLARTFTLRWKVNLMGHLKKKPTLLDYGCGTGELLQACQQKGWSVAGLEPSPGARQKATEITGINIATHLDEFIGQQFDIITLWHVLEHIIDLRKTISALKTLLGQNGLLLLAVPNCESYDATHYKEYWAGYDVPRHLWHFTQSTMTSLLKSEGFTIHSIKPMRLDAYYVSLLSEKYKSPTRPVSLQFLKGILNGFLSNQNAHGRLNQSSLIYIVSR